MIIRQSEYLAYSLMKETLETVNFPVSDKDLSDFFNNVKNGDRKEVSAKLAASLENGKVVAILLPFYHAYMEWAKTNKKPIAEAHKIFLGLVSFPFIETKAINLPNGSKLSAAFRALREQDDGIMGILIEKLEAANQTYQPQPLSDETKEHLRKIYNAREKQFYVTIGKYNESRQKAAKLAKLCHTVALCFDEGSKDRNHLLKIQETIEHVHDRLKEAIRRGDQISEDEIQNCDEFLRELLKHVDINQKNADGLTPLQLASQKGKDNLVKDLLQAGADPTITSTGYERSRQRIIQDLSRTTPPRNAAQIADINGHAHIAELIQAEISRREKEKAAIPPKKELPLERGAPPLAAAVLHAESFAVDKVDKPIPDSAQEEMRKEWTHVIQREAKKNQAEISATKNAIAEWEKGGEDASSLKEKMAFYLRVKFALAEISNFIPKAKSNDEISEKAKVFLKQVEDRLGADHNVCQILSRISRGEHADEAPRSAPRME